MVGNRNEQITIDLDAETKARLLAAAEVKGVDVSSYCLHVLEREVTKDEQQAEEQTGKPYDFDRLFAFYDESLGSRKLSKTGFEHLGDAKQHEEPTKRLKLNIDEMIRLREEQFGERVFPGDSVDIIREARELRTRILMGE